MPSSDSVFRKRWPFLAAIVALLIVALATGTLFAANERQQPEAQPQPQQSVADAADPGRVVDLPAAPPAPERVPAQQDDNDEEEVDLPPIVKVPPKHPNLDSNLNRLVEQAETGTQPGAGQQPSATDSAGGGSAPASDPVLVTFYIEPEQVATVRQFLEDNDVFVRNVGEDWIEAHVPPALLPAASERPGVQRVNTVIPPQPQSLGSVVSQGVELHQADAWHRMGYRGQGVKVGVIDDGYQGFSQMQGGELPRSVTARCYFAGARTPSSRLSDCEQAPCEEIACIHGTAVAETLVDVAPEVELYIANPISQGDLRDAADWMAEQGVQVINMSLGWIADGPGDGTSPSGNSPLRSVDAAVSGGITWANAAGNSARNAWYGAFWDPDDDGWHNFTSRDEANTFFLPYDPDSPSRSRVVAFMRWDDSWGGADCDLDLHLVRAIPGPNNDVLVFSDETIQDGGADDIPFAGFWYRTTGVAGEGTYYLLIRKRTCPDAPAWIQLITWMADDLQHYSTGRHITNPAEGRNPGMLAVGATHWWDTEYIASYSSRGPALDGRTKPDITGVACARSATYGPSRPGSPCPFGGTSQASPHVAGLAALVKQRFPDYTPEQVADYLQQNAIERGTAGKDSVWGNGFAILPIAPLTPATNIAVRAGDNPGEVIVSWDSVPGATHYRIGYVNMEVDYHLATASCTEEWIEAFIYVDVNAQNIPVSNGRAEYTIRRLSPGARHAFTVLTSNNFVDTGGGGSVGSEFFWPPIGSRWEFLPGRDTLPEGVAIPELDCNR